MKFEEILDMIRYQIRERRHKELEFKPIPELFLVVDLDIWSELRLLSSLGPVYLDYENASQKPAYRLDGAMIIPSYEITGWRVVA